MKVVIVAGGRGTRLSEETDLKPKPMVEIGGWPILWHIMKIYSSYGINDFIICCGYRGYMIKDYFANYHLHQTDVTIDMTENKMEVHRSYSEPWRITLVNTGLNTMTGGRLKRVEEFIGNETFCFTYGDGLCDVNIHELIQYHNTKKSIATVTATHHHSRFGVLCVGDGRVTDFVEKPRSDGNWMNSGFFVFEPGIFDYIDGDETVLEAEPVRNLVRDRQLSAFVHDGFFQGMDSLRDRMILEDLWESGQAPWKVWEDPQEGTASFPALSVMTNENVDSKKRGTEHSPLRKILVTGNLGYVGPSVVRQLRASYPDAELIGLDAGFYAHCQTAWQPMAELQLDQQIFKDIRRISPDLFEGCDAVVHLAAISNDAMSQIDERLTYEINYEASASLAAMAKRAGVRSFAFASSCSVYGCGENGFCDEQSKTNPLTAYARSKLMLENELGFLADSSFMVTCLRFATACGMSERLRLDLVLNDFVASALVSGEIKILSDGTPWRPLIHVRDMARALAWAVGREKTAGGDFLVVNAGSSSWNYRISDLAEHVSELLGCKVTMNRDASPDARSYRVQFDRFQQLAPQHQPTVSLESAISELRDGLIQIQFRDTNFRKSDFIRINVLKKLVAANLVAIGPYSGLPATAPTRLESDKSFSKSSF